MRSDFASCTKSNSLERLEVGAAGLDAPSTPRGGRVAQVGFGLSRATSLLFKVVVIAAGLVFILVLVVMLPLLLTDAYSHVSWPLVYGAMLAFLSQLSSLGKGARRGFPTPLARGIRLTRVTRFAPQACRRSGFSRCRNSRCGAPCCGSTCLRAHGAWVLCSTSAAPSSALPRSPSSPSRSPSRSSATGWCAARAPAAFFHVLRALL